MTEVLKDLAIAVGIYWAIAGLWWAGLTANAHDKITSARWNHDIHEKLLTEVPYSKLDWLELERSQKVRDSYLTEGRRLAKLARKAPVWPFWSVAWVSRGMLRTLASVTEVRLGQSVMDKASLRDKIERTEDELQRLKDEQERT